MQRSMSPVERPAAPAPNFELSAQPHPQPQTHQLHHQHHQQPVRSNLNSFYVNKSLGVPINGNTSLVSFNHFQPNFTSDQAWVPSALLGTVASTYPVSTNGSTAGGGTRPTSPMSYLLAMPNGQALRDTPFVPFSAELEEDPTAISALNQLGLELVNPPLGEEMGTDSMDMDMDMEWEEREGWDDLDIEKFTSLFGEFEKN